MLSKNSQENFPVINTINKSTSKNQIIESKEIPIQPRPVSIHKQEPPSTSFFEELSSVFSSLFEFLR